MMGKKKKKENEKECTEGCSAFGGEVIKDKKTKNKFSLCPSPPKRKPGEVTNGFRPDEKMG